jgi:serine protease
MSAYCHRSAAILLLTLATWLGALPAQADPAALKPRVAADKSKPPRLPGAMEVTRVVVKFHEGTRVRLRGGLLTTLDRGEREERGLAARGLTPAAVDDDVAEVRRLVALAPRVRGVARLFTMSETGLAARRASGEAASGRELADLDLYFELRLKPRTTAGELAELLADLNALASVEVAYAEPPAVPAHHTSGPTPNFQGAQSYLNAAPTGIDAYYSWTLPGGKGEGVRIVDVEGGWRTTHEDLPPLFYQGGTQISDPTGNWCDAVCYRNHGTAVLGELVGKNNGLGVTGISHLAQAGYESFVNQSIASAITNAAAEADPGGLVLLEMQWYGPIYQTCQCAGEQCGYVPVEWLQAEFDAISTATAGRVNVVEAAGNGESNLDNTAVYGNVFQRWYRDSGAIMVGAGHSAGHSPICWSNYGSRLDLQGFGESVTTLGYGDLFDAGGENRFYTAAFGGTSGASPIVTGAAANLQGRALATIGAALTPGVVRQILRDTGTAQGWALPRQIGPLPNLRAALDYLAANQPPVARFTFSCSGLSCSFNATGSTDDRGPIASYSWSWAAGSPSTPGPAVTTHLFPASNFYDVTLTVTDGYGVAGSTTRRVTVTSELPLAAETYFPVPPCRVYDSRNAPNTILTNQPRIVNVAGACGIPSAAKAVSFNVTAVAPTDGGHLVLYRPGSPAPATPSVNFVPATSPRGNNAILRLNDAGEVGILPYVQGSPGQVHVVLDVQGYFSESPSGLGFQTLTPCRFGDTRTPWNPVANGQVRSFKVKGACGVPANATDAQVASLNVSAVQPTGGGHVTLFPAGQPVPGVGTINFPAGIQALSNGARTNLASSLQDDLSAHYVTAAPGGTTHLTLDVSGYFGASAPLRYRPITSCRAVDTRFANQGAPALASGAVRSFQIQGNCGVPVGAKAAALNVTVIGPTATGHLTAYPSGIAIPPTATMSFQAGESALINGAIVPLSTLGDDLSINMFAPGGSLNITIDVFGYFQ